MDTQLSILRIAAGAGLALGSKLMPELVEATRWSNIGWADMVAGGKMRMKIWFATTPIGSESKSGSKCCGADLDCRL
jgi:hypothetical protein